MAARKGCFLFVVIPQTLQPPPVPGDCQGVRGSKSAVAIRAEADTDTDHWV